MIPDPAPDPPRAAGGEPFVWAQDEVFAQLEREAAAVMADRANACAGLDVSAGRGPIAALDGMVDDARGKTLAPDSWELQHIEEQLFRSGAQVAACRQAAALWVNAAERAREEVKRQARAWPPDDRNARNRAYRLLYGGRAAIEEVLLQLNGAGLPALRYGIDEPSTTPSVVVHGVRIHSGDILVSRGGAPTSALIARGNDRPGNFSHIALVHVDEQGHGSVIESHIESGVVVSTPEQYLGDEKLRILVLRLRADLPAMRARPTIPHEAASRALRQARSRHIPYDFAMDAADHDAQFCSEVASAAYQPHGIELWEGLSSMSGRGVTRWLGSFGVSHFETQAPSDLEYDPKLVTVAEWRDPETLWQDHVDNAVIDAMLERADRGAPVEHDHWVLPVARLVKAWSVVLNAFGTTGPVPEGMSATVALRAEWLRGTHARIARRTRARARDFQGLHHYRAPYWRLVELAREETGVALAQ